MTGEGEPALFEIVRVGLELELGRGRGGDDVGVDPRAGRIGFGGRAGREGQDHLFLGLGAASPAGQRIGPHSPRRFEFEHPVAGARPARLHRVFRPLIDPRRHGAALPKTRDEIKPKA
jgi:hypothetical protein